MGRNYGEGCYDPDPLDLDFDFLDPDPDSDPDPRGKITKNSKKNLLRKPKSVFFLKKKDHENFLISEWY